MPPEATNSAELSAGANGKVKDINPSGKRMSTMDLIKLSISMAGAQIAWTVELGYGTPFLLSLGLSEQLTSLVWLAGPISGLIAQPVIGAISDASRSKYRRRYWVVLSTIVLVVSTFTLAYCQDLAAFFVDLFGGGKGSWDPQWTKDVKNTAIILAIVSFYLLDFALNALQASLRNLLLDVTPPEQLNSANAWHSRMTNAGNIVGFGFGFLPLASMPILRLLGGDQFRKFCVISIILLVITVWITCWSQEEQSREDVLRAEKSSKILDVLRNIQQAVIALPKPIRRVCYVQVFAFMGWFPFLFYATTYIGQVMAYELGHEPDNELATRTGEFAMSIYSVVAVLAGTLLPRLTQRDARLLAHDGDEDEDIEFARLKATVQEWRAEAARKGEPLKLPFMPFFLRNIWTGAMLLFAAITLSTFFITKVWQATIAVSLVGICWAVACWVPFAIIMEFLKEREQDTPENGPPRHQSRRPSHSRTVSTPARPSGISSEREPLLRRRRSFDNELTASPDEDPVAGGTILGIHNLAIVFPQFIVALVSSAIFRTVDSDIEGDPGNHNTYYGKNGVAWVLRFGGLCALFGAVVARMVPPTRTEKQMRRRLAEIKLLQSEGTP
ncbi:MFS general substrate transporter [Trametopsis cervina]|nr:MFS general substrate transporter [Trametopsis cervina]